MRNQKDSIKATPGYLIAERIEARIYTTALVGDTKVDIRLYRAMTRGAEIALEEYHKEEGGIK